MSSAYFQCIDHTVPASHVRQYARATANLQEDELQLAVKQYKPLNYEAQPGDVTILACQASGFPKELYEPLWDALYQYTRSQGASFRLRAVWIMDIANQGSSGMLNDGKLGNEPSWHDYARDYLNMVNLFRKEMPRPIVGFGHSMGGSVIMDIALMHPRLLTTLVTIEPIAAKTQAGGSWAVLGLTSFRRDRWSSAQAAEEHFRKGPLHAAWDERVLTLYCQHGLKSIADADGSFKRENGPVALKTSRDQEVLTFARAHFPVSHHQPIQFDRQTHPEAVGVDNHPENPYYRPESTQLFAQLPYLRPSCLYIYGTESTFRTGGPTSRREQVDATGVGPGGSGGVADGRVKELDVKGSHFLPFERPDEHGHSIGLWINEEMVVWREAEARETESWAATPHDRKSTVTDDWLFWTKELFVRPKPADEATKAKL